MTDDGQDGLWRHFGPLWTDLRSLTPNVLLTGGYALFLKQRWLMAQSRAFTTSAGEGVTDEQGVNLTAVLVPTLIEMPRWSDVNPRVTKDFDLIVSLELIASEEDQRALDAVLVKHGFEVVPHNARWQFEKKISADQSVQLDFHAPLPAAPRHDLRVENRRVKPGRSLGSEGIHGRGNPAAGGAGWHPFTFSHQSVELVIPHPVAFAIMKLVAMEDRRRAAADAARSPAERQDEGRQARKHAEDVMRIIAMTTRSEMDGAESLLVALRDTPSYAAAMEACRENFMTAEGWGTATVARLWREDDFALMRNVLNQWFR